MREEIQDAIFKILRPLVRILLRNGIAYGTFSEVVKQVYVAVAAEEFGIVGRKQSDSRISILTGLTRKDVRRIKIAKVPDNEAAVKQYHRAARIISGWVRNSAFHDERGEPSDLPLEAPQKGDPSFDALVKRCSGDMPTRAVLDELLRVGAVARLPDDRIRLLTRAYLPREDESKKLSILGADVGLLIQTIDHNLSHVTDNHFQRKVAYDNLPREAIPVFRALSAQKGQVLLEEMDEWLSQQDRDRNPNVEGAGRIHAGLGIYYFEEDQSDEGDVHEG